MTTTYTDILIFKTNITSDDHIKDVAMVFNNDQRIRKWTIDRNDIDRVLRVETSSMIADDILTLVRQCGFYCEELED